MKTAEILRHGERSYSMTFSDDPTREMGGQTKGILERYAKAHGYKVVSFCDCRDKPLRARVFDERGQL